MLSTLNLSRLFFTGVPGSRWSGIAQTLELMLDVNSSDRTPERTYDHHSYSGHKGVYFGNGMELPATFDRQLIDSAWTKSGGIRIVKSHDWAYQLHELYKTLDSDEKIMLVYRPDMASYAWWHEAGGFQIQYPSYRWYEDSHKMLQEIQRQNKLMLEFAYDVSAKWEYFTSAWIKKMFGHNVEVKEFKDILVTIV